MFAFSRAKQFYYFVEQSINHYMQFFLVIRKGILVALFACVHCCAKSQSATEIQVTNYDETNGLQTRIIPAILQDSKGYIWAGTADGLSRFDGYNFKTFRKVAGDETSIAGNSITKLAEDKVHHIWMGLSREGLSCLNPLTGKFTNYSLTASKKSTLDVTMLFIDSKNEVWAGVRQMGLMHLDKLNGHIDTYDVVEAKDTFYTPEFRNIYNTVYCVYEDKKGMLWLGTHNGLYKFDKTTKKMEAVREKSLQKGAFRNDLFNAILGTDDGLWMGAWGGGLSHYDFKTGQWKIFKPDLLNPEQETTNIISDVKLKSSNELWITSNDRGLNVFDINTGKFTPWGSDKGIPDKMCFMVMQDADKNLWLSSNNGLAKIQMREKQFLFTPFPVTKSENGRFYGVTKIIDEKNWQLTGTSMADGLHYINKKNGSQKVIAFKVSQREEKFLIIYDMLRDKKGNIWVLTRDDLYRFDTLGQQLIKVQGMPAYTSEIPGSSLRRFTEDSDGKLWIVTQRNGVLSYDVTRNIFEHYQKQSDNKNSLPSNVGSCIAVDIKGRIWVGGINGLFGYFDKNDRHFTDLISSGKYEYCSVSALTADSKGNIWAGTDIGLHKIDCSSDIPQLKKTYTAADGLWGDVASEIKEDNQGMIWCITTGAVCAINPQTGRLVSFGSQDGLIKSNMGERFMFSYDGKMILAARAGYYLFNPGLLRRKTANIPLAVSSFKVRDAERYYEDELNTNGRLELAAGENQFSFEFAALDFIRPDQQQYAYMLEGFDKDWIYSGNRRYASYTNIPGGTYTFKVKATNTPDDWGNSAIIVPIHINQPFYKTWWFISLASITVLAGIFALYRFRLKRHRQILSLEMKTQTLEKEKALVMYENLKQQLNPHFLFNSLTSLGSLINTDQKMARQFLDQMSKIYRYILKSRDTETVLLSEDVKLVQIYVQLQQTRFNDGLLVNIDIDEEYAQCRIVPVTLQNLLENAIKHNIIDTDSPLVIDITTGNEYLVVRNNLQKKKFVETSNGQGLANMKSLYKYLSGKEMFIEECEHYFTVKIPLI